MDANRLVRQHKDVVYTLCLQVLRHRQDAEDACQEALLKIARRLPPDVEPDAWIHRVALRTAIDHRRARMRRRTREEKSARPESVGEEAAPALLEALEALPDEDRTLLVERFFARRTLRAMADARGVSEPAVWKRVEKGKEKLRQALLATAPALVATMDGALEAVVPARAPAHVLPAASAKSAILLAALALPAVVAAGLAARTPSEPDPAPSSGSRPPAAAAPAPKPDPAAAAAPTPGAEAVPGPGSVCPPYPWEMPPRHWPEVRRTAWRRLHLERIVVDATDALFHEILADLARRSGVALHLDAAVPAPTQRVAFKVKDLVLMNALKLLASQFGLDVALRSDGVVWLTTHERQVGEPDPIYAAAQAARDGLERARRALAAGRKGLQVDDPVREALAAVVDIPPGAYPLTKLVDRLRSAGGVNVHISGIDLSPPDPELERKLPDLERRLREIRTSDLSSDEMKRLIREHRDLVAARSADPPPRSYAGGRRTVKAHLDELAATWNAGYAPADGLLLICPPGQAGPAWTKADAELADRRSAAARLSEPVSSPPPATLAALCDALPKATGLKLICAEDVWSLPIPEAPTWRELLEGLTAGGLNWVYEPGAIYVVR